MFPSVVSTVMTNHQCSYPYFAGDIWHVLITTFPTSEKPSHQRNPNWLLRSLAAGPCAVGFRAGNSVRAGRGTTSNGWLTTKKEGRIIILAYLRYLLNRRVKVREYCHCSYLVNDLQLICQTKLHPVWASNPLAPKHWNGKLAKFKQLIIIIPRWSESLTIAWIEQKSVLHRKFSGPNWRVTTNKEQGTLQIWLIWLLSFDWVVSNKYMLI